MDEFLHLSASADLLGLGTKFDVVLLDPPWEESASHRWDRTEEAERTEVTWPVGWTRMRACSTKPKRLEPPFLRAITHEMLTSKVEGC